MGIFFPLLGFSLLPFFSTYFSFHSETLVSFRNACVHLHCFFLSSLLPSFSFFFFFCTDGLIFLLIPSPILFWLMDGLIKLSKTPCALEVTKSSRL